MIIKGATQRAHGHGELGSLELQGSVSSCATGNTKVHTKQNRATIGDGVAMRMGAVARTDALHQTQEATGRAATKENIGRRT